jgi:pimeloyl-ACP methyl ester carboxylesterase/AraC-like DNA-binding protein
MFRFEPATSNRQISMGYKIKYVRSGDCSIAYTSIGHGNNVLVMINGWVTNIEENDNLPGMKEWLGDLSCFSRVILFDKRGVGLSDRVNENELPDLETRIDDLRAIMDAEKLDRVTLWGVSCGGPMALMFACLYPENVKSVILFGSFARWVRGADYPVGIPRKSLEMALTRIIDNWGEPVAADLLAPSMKDSELFRDSLSSYFRKSASPGAALALYRMNIELDVTRLLPGIKVPVLVMHRSGDRLIPAEMGKFVADRIPDARWLELRGNDHLPFVGDRDAVTRAIARFMGVDFDSISDALGDGKLNEYDIRILNEIRSHLDAHFLDDFSIDALSLKFGINTFKLKHGFRKLFGMPVIAYVREKRLNYSASLIRRTDMPIKEIAWKAGYRVPGSFTKAFHQRFDESPTDVRKSKKMVV